MCVRRSEALGEDLDQAGLPESAARFRYQRGLLAADEFEAWLGRWGVTVGEWGAYLKRSLLLERWADELDSIEARFRLEDGAVDESEFVDAVCSGFLEREAHCFAADAALAALAPGEAAGEQALLVERIQSRAAAARLAATSASGVEREIAGRGLDWTRIELDALELAEEGAAREAALCVRLDGRALAELAEECATPLRRVNVYLEDAEPGLRASLLAAQPGELVGPVTSTGAFVLLAIHTRTPPSPTDPELRRRAETELVERVVKRALEGRVEWHEHV